MLLDITRIKLDKIDKEKGLILPEKMTLELAEEIGLHIGDGSMNFYQNKKRMLGSYSLRGHIQDDKHHYLSRIAPLYQRLYNLKPRIREMPSTGVIGFQIWSNGLTNFKHQLLKLPLGKKENIKIPQFIYKHKEYIPSIIRGVYDTDGTLYLEKKYNKLYPRIQINTVSNLLAEQLKKSLNQLDIRTTKYTQIRKEKNWNNLHTISIRGEKMMDKFFNIIQPFNPKHLIKLKKYLKQK
ncbi:MAG: LAGLIDADG family homing endonuclease [Candidatus Nanoarchaeia archaeon]|nr:LAGLIDADG family homing endonuclease [Candidatus Nanoarchaeia archaeon]